MSFTRFVENSNECNEWATAFCGVTIFGIACRIWSPAAGKNVEFERFSGN
jgi:hypothetical protein